MKMEGKTPVTLLQELLTKKKLIPTYNLILNGDGTHEPIFKYEVSADGLRAVGTGKSKKEAKHDAAHMLLLMMEQNGIDRNVTDEIMAPYQGVMKDNAVGELLDFCMLNNLKAPEYRLIRDEGLPHAKVFSWSCSVSSFTTEATSRTKKDAKQRAAQEMLTTLKDCLQDIVVLQEAEPKKEDPNKEPSLMDKEMEEVIQRLSSLPPTAGVKRIKEAEKLGTSLADVCFALKDENLPELPYLDRLVEQYDDSMALVNKLEAEAAKTTLDSIMRNFGREYTLENMTAAEEGEHLVGIILHTTPSWTFMGWGKDSRAACKMAYIEALKFLIKMRK
ncbi:Double-stranded RNA Hypothetical protein motif [Nesidiocoris tenuis]|uniref:DRBM domain-containing protein n=1 Tax=Nesidiocoris tenuis TaxID=355587 RepID=A0ABN7AYX8_9HEMI|nr:Double-stranded RNA Hypothetical protein motif [Nesidiocoris tenuis]